MNRASPAQHRYFERIATLNRSLGDGAPPASLAEMFDRMEHIERVLGQLAQPGVQGPADGDLGSHIAFLEWLRAIERSHRA